MRRINFTAIKLLIFFILLTLPVNLKALMFGNESDSAYITQTPPPNGVASICSITLRQLIADGGSHFFKSTGHISQFFSLVESSEITGMDYEGLKKNINGAIFYLEKASDTYLQLINLAAVTPYNQEVIFRLVRFDYDLFQKENGLFPIIFEKVKDLLAAGNVTGIYNEFYSNTGYILDLLYTVKKDVDSEIFPNLSYLWSVNQTYAEFKLFAQYVAQIFCFIK